MLLLNKNLFTHKKMIKHFFAWKKTKQKFTLFLANEQNRNWKFFKMLSFSSEWGKVIAALVGVVALLICVVVVISIQWKKFKGRSLHKMNLL